MSRRRISQREARAAITRVRELEARESMYRNSWHHPWPQGEYLGAVTWEAPALVAEAACTARKLGHAVVVVAVDTRKEVRLYAVPLAPHKP